MPTRWNFSACLLLSALFNQLLFAFSFPPCALQLSKWKICVGGELNCRCCKSFSGCSRRARGPNFDSSSHCWHLRGGSSWRESRRTSKGLLCQEKYSSTSYRRGNCWICCRYADNGFLFFIFCAKKRYFLCSDTQIINCWINFQGRKCFC